MTVGSDSTVFLANGNDGLRAYSYDGTSFTNTAHIDNGGHANGVTVGPDSTVFLANDYDGLRAYNFGGKFFTNTAHINIGDRHYAFGAAVGPDGMVFLATSRIGKGGHGVLEAYSYEGTSFTNTASISGGQGWGEEVVVASDGTVFWANGPWGLSAYTYSGYTGIERDYSSVPQDYTLLQNYPNPFNPVTTINYKLQIANYVELTIYDLLGRKVVTLVNEKQTVGSYQVEWDASGFASGIYYYKLEAGEFVDVRKMALLR